MNIYSQYTTVRLDYCNSTDFIKMALNDTRLYMPEMIRDSSLSRQCEFLAGRWCAIKAMEILKVKNLFQPLVSQQNFPIWPTSVLGSISHSSHTAGAFVTLVNPSINGVGFDIETIFDKQTASILANRILSKQERAFSCFFKTFEEFVSVVFSAKEAFYKGIYKIINKRIAFSVIEIQQICVVNQYIEFITKRDLITYYPKGSTFIVTYTLKPTWVETRFLLNTV